MRVFCWDGSLLEHLLNLDRQAEIRHFVDMLQVDLMAERKSLIVLFEPPFCTMFGA